MSRDARKAMIGKVHLAKAALGLEDEEYRALLRRASGKDSSAKMTMGELDKTLAEFKRLGWQPSWQAKPTGDWRAPAAKAYVRKIYSLWWGLTGIWPLNPAEKRRRLRRFVRRQTGRDDPEWLTPADANKVIEGIKAIKKRQAIRTG